MHCTDWLLVVLPSKLQLLFFLHSPVHMKKPSESLLVLYYLLSTHFGPELRIDHSKHSSVIYSPILHHFLYNHTCTRSTNWGTHESEIVGVLTGVEGCGEIDDDDKIVSFSGIPNDYESVSSITFLQLECRLHTTNNVILEPTLVGGDLYNSEECTLPAWSNDKSVSKWSTNNEDTSTVQWLYLIGRAHPASSSVEY